MESLDSLNKQIEFHIAKAKSRFGVHYNDESFKQNSRIKELLQQKDVLERVNIMTNEEQLKHLTMQLNQMQEQNGQMLRAIIELLSNVQYRAKI